MAVIAAFGSNCIGNQDTVKKIFIFIICIFSGKAFIKKGDGKILLKLF